MLAVWVLALEAVVELVAVMVCEGAAVPVPVLSGETEAVAVAVWPWQ